MGAENTELFTVTAFLNLENTTLYCLRGYAMEDRFELYKGLINIWLILFLGCGQGGCTLKISWSHRKR
jgi:hypothetical protein